MMIAILMAVAWDVPQEQSDALRAACDRLKENNMFCPLAPEPERPPREERGPEPPPPPRTREIRVAGIVVDAPTQDRYVLFSDVQWEQGVYCKAGDTYCNIVVLEVGEDVARLRVGEEEEREVRLGESFRILDQGRPDGDIGRLAPRAPDRIPGGLLSAPTQARSTEGGSPLEQMRERFRDRIRGRENP